MTLPSNDPKNEEIKRSKIKDLAMFSFDGKTRHSQSPIFGENFEEVLKLKRKEDFLPNFQKNLNEQAGITLIALIITIVVLLILASITIASITRDNGIVKNATEAQILSALNNVDEALEIYKMKNEGDRIKQGDYSGEISNEDLIVEGIIKSIEDKSTGRLLGIIQDFDKLGLNEKLGKGYKDIQLDENENIASVNDLYNVYLIDLEDNTLYYVKNEQVWSIAGINNLAKISERTKFITQWNITENNLTVILPITEISNDIKIDWGDGTEEEIIEVKPSHEYAKTGEYDIKITGTSIRWDFGTVADSKTTITKIKQWGNIEFKGVFFSGCENIVGSIPSPNENNFKNLTVFWKMFYNCSKIEKIPGDLFKYSQNATLFERTFENCTSLKSIPNNLLENNIKAQNLNIMFSGCTSLEKIPENFVIPERVNCISSLFAGCSKIETVPDSFKIPDSVTDVRNLFFSCTALKNISNNFVIPENVTTVNGMFDTCTSLKMLPDNFEIPSKVENAGALFKNCTYLEKLPDNFNFPDSIKNLSQTFRNCTNLTNLPANFKLPENVEDLYFTFYGCTSLESLPEEFIIPDTVTEMSYTFCNCSSLKVLPDNFKIGKSVINMSDAFYGCGNLTKLPNTFVLPETVERINNIFFNCGNLGKLPDDFKIPSNCKNIREAFFNCDRLYGNIIIDVTPTEFNNCFYYTASKAEGKLVVDYTANCTNISEILERVNEKVVLGSQK